MVSEARQSRRALLGSLIIAALFAVAVGIFLLDDLLAALDPTYHIVAITPEAPGLGPGAVVWVGGREVGTVTGVAFHDTEGSASRLVLTLELPTSVREQVRRDSDVRITSATMVGDPVVDVIPGTAAAPPLADGDTLMPPDRPDAEELKQRALALRADLDSLRASAAALGLLVERRQAGFARIEQHLSAARLDYDALMQDVARSPALALLGGGEVSALTERLSGVLQELSDGLARQQAGLRDSGVREGVQRLQQRADRTRRALAALQAEMEGGTVDRMMRDSALSHAIGRARTELDSLIAEARRNPLQFVL